MTIKRSVATLLCAAALTSCDYDKTAVQTIGGPVPAGGLVRFFHFGVSAPGVNFYADTRKMTSISSATGVESTTGTAYGAVGSGGYYAAIDAGTYTLSGKIAATVDKDLAISSTPATIAAGKNYSYYLSGIYNAGTKTVDAFLVEDSYGATIDYTTGYVRLVHAISNAAPLTLYAKNTTTLVETAIGAEQAYKGAGAFTSLAAGTYDLFVRYNGSATNTVTALAVPVVAGRVYTITARGDITVGGTTSAIRPILTQTANR